MPLLTSTMRVRQMSHRTVQEYLGHQCIETTMIYLHVMEDHSANGVSPLDRMPVPQN